MIGLDIEMPKCCDECPLSDHTGELDGYCLLTNTWSTQHKAERLDKCPLVDLADYHDCTACVHFYDPDDE
jgi:hypothetical protein